MYKVNCENWSILGGVQVENQQIPSFRYKDVADNTEKSIPV